MKKKREEIKDLILKLKEQQEQERQELERLEEALAASPGEPDIQETPGSNVLLQP